MTTNELMIGDWMSLRNKPYKIGALTSQSVILKGYEPSGVLIDCNDIEPIPLTAEILEKNGWEHFGIFMETRVDENTRFGWTDRYGAVLYRNTHYMCDCKDVHTLQHAFRLCGRNDLADNFVI